MRGVHALAQVAQLRPSQDTSRRAGCATGLKTRICARIRSACSSAEIVSRHTFRGEVFSATPPALPAYRIVNRRANLAIDAGALSGACQNCSDTDAMHRAAPKD